MVNKKKEEELESSSVESKDSKGIIAKKDWVLNDGKYYVQIKEGDDIIDLGVPPRFDQSLVTEGIIKSSEARK